MLIIINNNKFKILKKKYKKYIIKYKENKFVCISINNKLFDEDIRENINASIFYIKIKNTRALNIIRHSCAHLMAHALTHIYPEIKLSVGPVIKNGFYYDFKIKNKIKEDDLNLIENKMEELSKKKIVIIKKKINIKKTKEIFKDNIYKLNIIDKIKEKNLTLYQQADFIDLCTGPHIRNTSLIKNFKLLKISGAYWNNNKKNEMLYRIYGTLWDTKEKLENYIISLKENELNDHKSIGKNLNLFIFDKDSQGVVFWNKNGWQIYSEIVNYIKNIMKKNNYKEVNTPIMLEKNLFERSGHLEKFNQHIFKYKTEKGLYVLKPMNCPCHANIFNNFYKKSYKDLPLKISEFGSCFRNELSGALHGLMRLKNFTQDDAHIFCDEKNIITEIIKFINILKKVYYFFDFKVYKIVLSKKPNNIKSNQKKWDKAEYILEKSLMLLKLKYTTSNEGAFYGPKIEFSLKDKFNRIWQCGTIQVDFFTSKRLNVHYSDKNGKLKNPIILHRAILGSIERFIGILLENKNGKMPFKINQIQFEIIYINEKCINYSKKIYNLFKKKYKIKLSINKDKIDYKIKRCILEKIPYIIIIGENEVLSNTITIRKTKINEIRNISVNKLLSKIKLNEF